MHLCPQATLHDLQERLRSGNLPVAEQARVEKLQKTQFPKGTLGDGIPSLHVGYGGYHGGVREQTHC